MEGLRVRLQFEDRHILRKSQRKEGLKRCWVVLKPEHATISDLASHLQGVFQLQASCPYGLILSMDGFVLPPFESTSVLKDNDVVWARKKEQSLTGAAWLDNETNPAKALQIVEKKQRVNKNLLLLANEEFVKESGGYESESEEDDDETGPSSNKDIMKNAANEDAGSKKRKASKKLKSPKRKKSRLANAEESPAACKTAQNEETISPEKSAQDNKVLTKESRLEKDKPSLCKERKDVANSSKNDREGSVRPQSSLQEKGKGGEDASTTPSEAKKLPSRRARRKKLKRQWLSQMRKIGKKDEGQGAQSSANNCWSKKFLGNNDQSLDPNDRQRKSERPQKQSDLANAPAESKKPHHVNSSNGGNIHVDVRPGHIHFEPLDEDADKPIQKGPVPVTTSRWNGVTDKNRQRWGKGKWTSRWADNGHQKNKWTDHCHQKTNWADSNKKINTWGGNVYEKTTWTEDSNSQHSPWIATQSVNQEPSQETCMTEETTTGDSTDFSKLSPYGPIPQEGDVVAYRLIELSTSWTPQVSTFRVGKLSCCNRRSKKIRLLPVPEHPFDLEKADKGLYREDGSLEVEFRSLIDVRALTPGKSEAAAKSGVSNTATSIPENKKNEGDQATTQENGGSNVWEEISQALNAKKDQLSPEDRWKQKGTMTTATTARGPPPSAYRGLRGSSLGPLMALLRSENAM